MYRVMRVFDLRSCNRHLAHRQYIRVYFGHRYTDMYFSLYETVRFIVLVK